MEYVIISSLAISILLFILSFFKKDKVKELEKEVEHLSLTFMQEAYQLKKKIKILEEEFLLNEEDFPVVISEKIERPVRTKKDAYLPTRDKIFSLYKQGYSYEQIAKQSELTTEEVRILLEHVWNEE